MPVDTGNECDGRHEDCIQAESPALGQSSVLQTWHDVRGDGAQPLNSEQQRGAQADPSVYRKEMTLVELTAFGFVRFLIRVYGVQPQRRHDERERVQYYILQCYV